MALTLDMSKAYDRVEWDYLRALLNKMGFATKMMDLFMRRVTSARYQINHASKKFGNIVPAICLRQGDPLSSYLFLICTEGFKVIIKNYESRGLIKGIQVARRALTVPHIFFAHKSYIFSKANREEALYVVNLLTMFKKASGQKINVEKSTVFFSCNVDADFKKEVCDILKKFINEGG